PLCTLVSRAIELAYRTSTVPSNRACHQDANSQQQQQPECSSYPRTTRGQFHGVFILPNQPCSQVLFTMASTDRDVLLVLHQSTGGARWKNKVNWGTDTPISQWCGVKVNDQGRVVEVFLGGNNLRGPIPPELGQLGALEILSLWENALSGTVPKELGKLNALKELYLCQNNLS
ncbi:unnamed protein product, partial [Pylaiella littoralis]